ncbi:hypothetical protein L209DRAFT_348440 [Thermothelomyces heterothallicus CBS 203.75]
MAAISTTPQLNSLGHDDIEISHLHPQAAIIRATVLSTKPGLRITNRREKVQPEKERGRLIRDPSNDSHEPKSFRTSDRNPFFLLGVLALTTAELFWSFHLHTANAASRRCFSGCINYYSARETNPRPHQAELFHGTVLELSADPAMVIAMLI